MPHYVFPNLKKACLCMHFLFHSFFDRVGSLLKYWVAKREDFAQSPKMLIDFIKRKTWCHFISGLVVQ